MEFEFVGARIHVGHIGPECGAAAADECGLRQSEWGNGEPRGLVGEPGSIERIADEGHGENLPHHCERDDFGLGIRHDQGSPFVGSVRGLDVAIDEVFEHFLAAAGIGGCVTFFEHVGFEFGEGCCAGFDAFTDAGIVAAVAIADEVFEDAVSADGGGDFETAGECVHATDVGVEQIDGIDAFAADFGIEVRSAGLESALLHDDEHDLSGEVDIGGELVGVPSEEQVAGIGVDAAEDALDGGVFEFVHHGVAGECGVVGFDIEFDDVHEPILADEVQAGCCVEVVLMFGGFLGFGFEEELSFEADGFGVVAGEVHEAGEVVEFAFHVGVPGAHVAFTAAPEDIVFTAEFVGDFDGLFYLSGGESEHVGVGAGGGTVHETGVGKQVGGAPQEPDAGGLLSILQAADDGVEVGVAFAE